jgi:hypothetical protein
MVASGLAPAAWNGRSAHRASLFHRADMETPAHDIVPCRKCLAPNEQYFPFSKFLLKCKRSLELYIKLGTGGDPREFSWKGLSHVTTLSITMQCSKALLIPKSAE